MPIELKPGYRLTTRIINSLDRGFRRLTDDESKLVPEIPQYLILRFLLDRTSSLDMVYWQMHPNTLLACHVESRNLFVVSVRLRTDDLTFGSYWGTPTRNRRPLDVFKYAGARCRPIIVLCNDSADDTPPSVESMHIRIFRTGWVFYYEVRLYLKATLGCTPVPVVLVRPGHDWYEHLRMAFTNLVHLGGVQSGTPFLDPVFYDRLRDFLYEKGLPVDWPRESKGEP